MKKHMAAALFVVALSGLPIAALGTTQTTAPKPSASEKHTLAPAATHAMKGVVKSIDDEMLVLTRSGRNHAEMRFALNGSTRRDGTIAPGTAVSVRYRDEGKTHVATAIRAEPARKRGGQSIPKP